MLQVGFARACITPPVGANMPGGFFPRPGTYVHDDLYATAIVLDNEETSLALVGLDALSVKHSTVEVARRLARKLCGIPEAHILVAASHTHNGGPTCDCLGSRPERAYCTFVSKQIASAIVQAYQRRQPALLAIGRGDEDSVAFNRRFVMKEGTETTHPGKMNPDIVRPAGPIDPEVGVLAIFAAEAKPTNVSAPVLPRQLLGCVINYALHGTLGVGGSGFSADWPYYLREAIRRVYGPNVETVFLNGACGDVTQVDNQSPRPSEFGEAFGQYVGHTIAAESIKVIERLLVEGEKHGQAPLAAEREILPIPMRPVTKKSLSEAQRYLREHKGEQSVEYVYAEDILRLAEWIKQEPLVPAEIQAMRVGPLGIVSNPAEYFCCFGLEIKKRSPFPQTFVVELANGCIGYVPDEKAFGPQGGGYEPRQACSSKLVPEAGRLIADKSVELLQRLWTES